MRPTGCKQFHEATIKNARDKALTGYEPVFPELPTNLSVAAESLHYSDVVTKQLGQQYCVVTSQKKHQDKYGHVVSHMEGFHIAMNFLGAIVHLMKGTGIEDILVEGGTCLLGSNKSLDGKDY